MTCWRKSTWVARVLQAKRVCAPGASSAWERLQASDRRPEHATELPRFVGEIKQIFEAAEIRAYLGCSWWWS
jgi:hypothetical protein